MTTASPTFGARRGVGRIRTIAFAAGALIGPLAAAFAGPITYVADFRFAEASLEIGGLRDGQGGAPQPLFSDFDPVFDAELDTDGVTATANAAQSSDLGQHTIVGSGSPSAGLFTDGSQTGELFAVSLFNIEFIVAEPVFLDLDYTLLANGGAEGSSSVAFGRRLGPNLVNFFVLTGTGFGFASDSLTFQLEPGQYVINLTSLVEFDAPSTPDFSDRSASFDFSIGVRPIPTPGGAGVLAVAGLIVGRRRRRVIA